MDIHQYLSKHDGRPRPDGTECARLAAAVGTTAYFLYMVAIGHKRFGPEKALLAHQHSIDREIAPECVRPDLEFLRDGEGVATGHFRKAANGEKAA